MDVSNCDIMLLKLDVKLFPPTCEAFLFPAFGAELSFEVDPPRGSEPDTPLGLESWMAGACCFDGVPIGCIDVGTEEHTFGML